MLIPMVFTTSVFAQVDDRSLMNICVSVSTRDCDGVVYSKRPYTIRAEYDNGSLVTKDLFTKKAWMRVDLQDENADLLTIFRENKEKVNVVLFGMSYYKKTYRTILDLDVTLNGTYLFLGWDSDSEDPKFIERVDITDIELERPMGWTESYMTNDYSSDAPAYTIVKNVESGAGTQIKRFALCKDFQLPPGSWPESLPPEYCNEYYDEWMERLYDGFVNGGLYLGDTYTNEGTEIIPNNNKYDLRESGDYILFMEDTNGRYSHHNFCVNPDWLNSLSPKISTEVLGESEAGTQVKVDVESQNDIARLDYTILGSYDFPESQNGTDEYFLEKEKHKLTSGEVLTIDSPVVVCAVDVLGNTNYKRIEALSEDDNQSPEPDNSPVPSPTATASAVFTYGRGTAEDPYIITTARELDFVRENLGACYRLGCDIDLTEYLSETGEGYRKWGDKGWEPIGSYDQKFIGCFDGNYHSITGLWINRETTDMVGLFGSAGPYEYDTAIQNLNVSIAQKGVLGNQAVGGLVGSLSAKRIKNCSVSAENENACVRGDSTVGGFIGSQEVTAQTYNCYSSVNVIGSSLDNDFGCVGGLIGSAAGEVSYSYAIGNVSGSRECGGLIGHLEGMASANNCGATGAVIGTGDYVGGLIGQCCDASVLYSYSTGDVSGRNRVGGIVGWQAGKSGICQSYYSGHIIGSDYVGGIAGAQISPPYYENNNYIYGCTAYGEITSSGEHKGAISGYTDEESSISNCSRGEGFAVNGNIIPSTDENSVPNGINGEITTEKQIVQSPIININISDLPEGEKSAEVSLNAVGLEDIKEINYVEVKQKPENQAEIETGVLASVNNQVDVGPLMTDFDNNIGLLGDREAATIVYNYYNNADYSGSAAVPVENNRLRLSTDKEYVICAEDNASNKTFVYINKAQDEPEPTPAPNEYLYQINDLSIQSVNGTALDAPPINESFIVEVSINKLTESESEDYLIAAVYDQDGMLLSLDYVRAKFAADCECSFGFNIPPQTRKIGSVKAYAWSDFNSLIPLAEPKTLVVISERSD